MKTDLWEMDSDKAIEYISKFSSVRAFKLFKAFDMLNHLTCRGYMTMLEDGRISRFKLPLLLWVHEDLRRRGESGQETYLHRLLVDKRLAAEKRALLYHAVFTSYHPFINEFANMFVAEFVWYNTCASKEIGKLKTWLDYESFKRYNLSPCINFHASSKVLEMIVNDKCSLFELNRQFEGRRICDSMLEFLMQSDAARCFSCLLSHYPKEVFKFRTPQEWLFTVCRCAKEKLAVAAVDEIERQFPGIVGSARDPWGNTLLWNTFVNKNPTEGLREELIRLGCEPNAQNERGLSYQLLKDNDPEKLLQEEESQYAV